MNRISFPIQHPWLVLDEQAIVDLIDDIGLTGQIAFEWMNQAVDPANRAEHECAADQPDKHTIRLGFWNSPEVTTEAIGHELEHARQMEQLGHNDYGISYYIESMVKGYWENDYEVQARAAGARVRRERSLCCSPGGGPWAEEGAADGLE